MADPQPNKQPSELEQLLEKNTYGGGLTIHEFNRALVLIGDPLYAKAECWVCSTFPSREKKALEHRAIYDTGLCQGHAHYALVTQK